MLYATFGLVGLVCISFLMEIAVVMGHKKFSGTLFFGGIVFFANAMIVAIHKRDLDEAYPSNLDPLRNGTIEFFATSTMSLLTNRYFIWAQVICFVALTVLAGLKVSKSNRWG